MLLSKKTSISYTGVILNQESHNRLVDSIISMPQIQSILESLSNPIAHHLTLTLGALKDPELEIFHNKEGEITCTHLGISEKAIAVKCSPVIKFSEGRINWETITKKGNGKFPHITVFVNKETGGRPFDSNNITDFIPLKQELRLIGTLKGIENQPPKK